MNPSSRPSLPADLPADDRRSSPRIDAEDIGILHSSAGKELCLVNNISAGGGMVHGHSTRSPGEAVCLELKNQMRLEARVVWSGDGEAGLEFGESVDVAHVLRSREALTAGQQPRLPRIEVGCTASVRVGDRIHRAKVIDISPGGAKLELRGPLGEGDISLSLPGLPRFDGVIRWTADGRAGVAFDNQLSFGELARWLAQYQRRIARTAWGTIGLITASCGMGAAVAAAGARATLTVGATVTDSCLVSSAANDQQVKISCTTGTNWSKTETAQQPSGSSAPGAQTTTRAGSAEAPMPRPAADGYVTITY